MVQKDDEEHDEDNSKNKVVMQCFICKEYTHLADNCPRDPNLRTNQDVEKEFQRIAINPCRKRFANDSQIVTYNMMEKLCKESNERGISQLMSQDDFNYG